MGSSAKPVVLCIAGSPRRNGNSDRFLDAFSAGVEDGGGTPVRLVAALAGANPCRGCNACSKTGVCIVRDGMDAVYAQVDSANALAIATPVFFATVPAVLKTLYDRFQPYWARRYILGEPVPAVRRPASLIVVGGGGDPFGMNCAVVPTRSVLGAAAFELIGVLEVDGLDGPSDALEHTTELDRARRMGMDLAREAAVRL